MSISFQVIAGLFCGYLTATLSESALHRLFGHASKRSRTRWSRVPCVGGIVRDVHYGHTVVHHKQTFRHNHVTQFREPGERISMQRELVAAGRGRVVKVSYGLVTDGLGAVFFVIAPIIVCTAVFVSFSGHLDAVFWIAVLPPILSTPLLSRYIHPYVHMRIAKVREVAPRTIVWILDSRYGRWVRISHFVHHRHPRYNFNLLPGGDFLLRTYMPPTETERAEMLAMGLIE